MLARRQTSSHKPFHRNTLDTLHKSKAQTPPPTEPEHLPRCAACNAVHIQSVHLENACKKARGLSQDAANCRHTDPTKNASAAEATAIDSRNTAQSSWRRPGNRMATDRQRNPD
ncbi:hypothetical protein Poly51_08790 [Rubripirellula tenax]|uniref:Uncharacterized protein n=1 Tax=Rubripirellula tenax TaxID=2528015 RepID=A0A5C6FGI9_9BACT|nr:hypothetical protein Poly51_08790 [Rubripirellula tenax]